MTLLLLASQAASAQNVFRIRIDTATMKAGDTSTVNVYYTFTSTKPHNLNGYVARFLFDSNLVKVTGYITSGTASDGLMTTESHQGLAAIGISEINLSNPVLFKLRIAASKTLADTAKLRWDPDWPVFASEAGVDTVIQSDGWVRTLEVVAHSVLYAPTRSVQGVVTGPYADSVRFALPILISDIAAANVSKARLTFTFDHNRLALDAVTSKLTAISFKVLPATSSALDTAEIDFQSASKIVGNDTLTTLNFIALVGPDTVCTSLMNVSWLPLNGDAKRGETNVNFDTTCLIHLFGRYQPASVTTAAAPVRLYPNPARDHVISTGSDAISFEVYDALGRLAGSCRRFGEQWLLPSTVDGTYRIVIRERSGEVRTSALVIEH